jgi:adenine-specific DNA-methyltransferase
MLRLIVKASSKPDDLVMDCFCGSGGTLVAAQESGRRWIGIDSSEAAIGICKRRLGIDQG